MSHRRRIAALGGLTAFLLVGCGPKAVTLQPDSPGREVAPDKIATTAQPFTITVPAAELRSRGTCTLWIKLDEPMNKRVVKKQIITSNAFELFLEARDDATYVLWHVIGAMSSPRPDGKAGLYWLAALMSHLNAGQWYHIALVWDTDDYERNGVFVDGIRQVEGSPYEYPGQLRTPSGDVEMKIGAPGVTVSALRFYQEPLDEAALRSICRASGHKGYTDEGLRFTGEKFIPHDVDRDHPVYVTEFDDPAELQNWKLEGGHEAVIENGRLILKNTPPDGKGNHLVFWLTKEMPADFLLEFEFKPKDRKSGLAIVFFNARGVNGESILDPSLAPRDGTFKQYTNGDINNYHTSYWAGGRGSANVRKNSGFYLTAIGKDLVWSGEADKFQTVSIYKRGGTIRLMVDDVLAVQYDDDGRSHGPVHTHPGWIGLRQMAHSDWCSYERLAVYPLKK